MRSIQYILEILQRCVNPSFGEVHPLQQTVLRSDLVVKIIEDDHGLHWKSGQLWQVRDSLHSLRHSCHAATVQKLRSLLYLAAHSFRQRGKSTTCMIKLSEQSFFLDPSASNDNFFLKNWPTKVKWIFPGSLRCAHLSTALRRWLLAQVETTTYRQSFVDCSARADIAGTSKNNRSAYTVLTDRPIRLSCDQSTTWQKRSLHPHRQQCHLGLSLSPCFSCSACLRLPSLLFCFLALLGLFLVVFRKLKWRRLKEESLGKKSSVCLVAKDDKDTARLKKKRSTSLKELFREVCHRHLPFSWEKFLGCRLPGLNGSSSL